MSEEGSDTPKLATLTQRATKNALRHEGAEIVRGVLKVTDEQLDQLREEARATGATIVGPDDDEHREESISQVRKELEGHAEIKKIVNSIEACGFFGKFSEGTHMQTGTLPNLIVTTDLYEDHETFSTSEKLQPIMHQQYRWIRRILEGTKSSRHFLTVQDSNEDGRRFADNKKLVTYFFPVDNKDHTGRSVGTIFTAFFMPGENADQLLAMIENNPDLAEEFFQQAAKGFERPQGTDNNHSGIGRIKLNQISIVPWDVIKKPSPNDRAIVRGNMPLEGARPSNPEKKKVFSNMRKYMKTVPYQHGPYGVAENVV
ncbi:MAG TPA: hypothetical protein VNW29_02885 [Candidatus Sulfotelmatobacter sp.]|jgi:hypothetical protein|nr:hypothetical protein [Candidatus Sulfotelmatobacter sp.]